MIYSQFTSGRQPTSWLVNTPVWWLNQCQSVKRWVSQAVSAKIGSPTTQMTSEGGWCIYLVLNSETCPASSPTVSWRIRRQARSMRQTQWLQSPLLCCSPTFRYLIYAVWPATLATLWISTWCWTLCQPWPNCTSLQTPCHLVVSPCPPCRLRSSLELVSSTNPLRCSPKSWTYKWTKCCPCLTKQLRSSTRCASWVMKRKLVSNCWKKKSKHKQLWNNSKPKAWLSRTLMRREPLTTMMMMSTEKKLLRVCNRRKTNSSRSMHLTPISKLKSNRKAMQLLRETRWFLCLGGRGMRTQTLIKKCMTWKNQRRNVPAVSDL